MQDLWLGLDVGTTSVKAAAWRPDGQRVALVERRAEVIRRLPGGAEQDMARVWQIAAECLAGLAAACGPARFLSLGVCAQGDGLWPMAADGTPAGPALLWNDTRASDDLAALDRGGACAEVGRGCHTALWAGTAAVLWRWLRRHDPQAAARTAHALTCADWIGWNLTGQIATDLANGSIPFMDFARRDYGAAVGALECADIAPHLPPLRRAGELLGGLSAQAARATGLPAGLPVAVGTLDLAAMIVGMGMDRPGQTMMIMGTTAVVNILTARPPPARPAPLAATVLHPTADVAIRVLAPSTGAAAFDWFASLHPASLGGVPPDEVARRINALVEQVPVGANGVCFLPYLNGERAPFVAAGIRAMFHGMSSATTKADLGRAVMEGAALSLRHCCVEEGGLPDAPVQLTGGGSRNPVWDQIIADVIGQSVIVSEGSDQGLWGAACIGAAAAGAGEPVALARARRERSRRFDPDPARARLYDRLFDRYAALSRGLRAMQRELDSIGSDAPGGKDAG